MWADIVCVFNLLCYTVDMKVVMDRELVSNSLLGQQMKPFAERNLPSTGNFPRSRSESRLKLAWKRTDAGVLPETELARNNLSISRKGNSFNFSVPPSGAEIRTPIRLVVVEPLENLSSAPAISKCFFSC